jgi:hypothetical protein
VRGDDGAASAPGNGISKAASYIIAVDQAGRRPIGQRSTAASVESRARSKVRTHSAFMALGRDVEGADRSLRRIWPLISIPPDDAVFSDGLGASGRRRQRAQRTPGPRPSRNARRGQPCLASLSLSSSTSRMARATAESEPDGQHDGQMSDSPSCSSRGWASLNLTETGDVGVTRTRDTRFREPVLCPPEVSRLWKKREEPSPTLGPPSVLPSASGMASPASG